MIPQTVQEEAVAIVQWGLSDVRAWVGEIPPEMAACDCVPIWCEVAHHKEEHKLDCWDSPPCGGCIRCIVAQYYYYQSLGRELWPTKS